MANLGDDTTPVQGSEFSLPAGAKLDEDGGDLVVRDSAGEIILRRDETAGNWDFANTSLTNLAAVETEEGVIANLTQADGQSITTHQAELVTIQSGNFETVFDLVDPVDIKMGWINGHRPGSIRYTYESGSSQTIGSSTRGQDAGSNTYSSALILPAVNVTKLEVSAAATGDYGYLAFTV